MQAMLAGNCDGDNDFGFNDHSLSLQQQFSCRVNVFKQSTPQASVESCVLQACGYKFDGQHVGMHPHCDVTLVKFVMSSVCSLLWLPACQQIHTR